MVELPPMLPLARPRICMLMLFWGFNSDLEMSNDYLEVGGCEYKDSGKWSRCRGNSGVTRTTPDYAWPVSYKPCLLEYAVERYRCFCRQHCVSRVRPVDQRLQSMKIALLFNIGSRG